MKAKVVENLCIGCGACQAIAPEEFELNDSGVSQALNEIIKEENKEIVNEAKEVCPTNAIIVEEN